MGSKFRDDLNVKLRDIEFAKPFGAAAAKTDFALTLSQARKSTGITQTDLAKKIGKTQSYIAKLERGDSNPTLATIGQILAVLGFRLSTGTTPLIMKDIKDIQTRSVAMAVSWDIPVSTPSIVVNSKSEAFNIPAGVQVK